MKLAGRNVAITGVGPETGLGRGFAEAFAAEGANLSINHLGPVDDAMAELVARLESTGVRVALTRGDISTEEVARELVERTVAELGSIDVLLNNAYVTDQHLVQDITPETWDRVLAVNLRSVYLTCHFAVPHMIAAGFGRIINMASQIGQKGGVEHSHYAASKAGIIGFTKSIALELGQHGITANCIAPGPIQTAVMATVNPAWRERKLAELALPRFGQVDEVTPTAILLASEPDGNIYTGQTLGPNSGDVMP
ncbi:3-oxoacyl-[acyl-carrier protein] reductase [Salana multivorans]|uniref:3-oxoacyl-[acyl-carrier protein] reductase n=1 Tax=Salana multivorans TaxID=120377 RepID=A0A3N2D8V8_9MICO|nr:SDR family NAD(P)-dependent oxidoreductase [Salana multivorans]ROR96226.1 3-oxoacyl-[acyl-carrier protein] reductase [Salana multivorans]